MSFAQVDMLYFLALVPLLVLLFVLSERRRKRALAALTRSEAPAMVMGAGFERRLVYQVFLCLGVAFLVLAAARPQWGTKLEQVRTRGIDIMVALDLSQSMLATDVSPDRISKAKQEIDKLLGLLQGDRVGLIGFAGSAFTFCPLTVDYGAIRLFLQGMEPGTIADGGTNIPAALEETIKTFSRSQSNAERVLVIFSDGENHEADPTEAVAAAVAEDIQVFTIGIGNVGKSGERIPLGDEANNGETTYKLDTRGNLVITRLDEATLQTVAETGGGRYFRVSEAGTELVQIYQLLAEKQEVEFSSKLHHQREDRYQLPLVVAIFNLFLAYALGHRSFKKLRRTQEVAA